MINVHIRINDTATGQPTAARMHISDDKGRFYAPLGRVAGFPTGRYEDVGGSLRISGESFTITEGSCEIPLPASVPLRIVILKGPEYEPISRTVVLGTGQMALRFEINRWHNRQERGWSCGDTHAHALTPHSALLEAAAEDLDVANLLVNQTSHLAQDGNTYVSLANISAFSGQNPCLSQANHHVFVNTANSHSVLGTLSLLHCHRVVYPLAFGNPYDSDDWSLMDWCRQCHRKKGLAVWTDSFRTSEGIVGGEALIAAILGSVDAIELDSQPRSAAWLPWYYRLLNAGVRLALVGGSGKDSNRTPLGAMRTYARTVSGEAWSYANWIESIRAGHSWISNGPMLQFEVDGRGPGDALEVAPGQQVTLTATAESIDPFERLEILGNGEVWQSVAPTVGERSSATLKMVTTLPTSGWLAARCVGAKGSRLFPALPMLAHTSPVWVKHPEPAPRSESSLAGLRALIDQTVEWSQTQGTYHAEKWRTQLLANATEAKARIA